MKKIILSIDGMTCSACSNGLEKYLNKQNGIINATVNLVMANATIDYDDNILNQEKIEKYIKQAGFSSAGIFKEFKIEKSNKKEKTNVVTKHAEIIAIEKACKKLKTWHLNDCILYTTVEPCLMCTGAIIQSRMKKVVYATENEKYGSLNKIVKESKSKLEIEKNILAEKSIALLQNFFNKKRK